MIRKLTIIAAILLTTSTFSTYAQITLEKSYPVSASIANLEKDGYKYYVMDVVNSECRIYNLDHSIWQIINISLPVNNYLYDIQYVSQYLFDQDDLVELVITYYEYIENGGEPYYVYGTKVIKQNAEEILNVPGGGYSVVTEVDGSDLKLLVYVYDFSTLPYTVSTNVYNITNTGSSAIKEPSTSLNMIMGNAYPNPADTYFIVPYHLNDNTDQAELVLSDPSGREIHRFHVDRTFDHLKIQRNNLPPGQYLYQLVTPYSKSIGKVIILK